MYRSPRGPDSQDDENNESDLNIGYDYLKQFEEQDSDNFSDNTYDFDEALVPAYILDDTLNDQLFNIPTAFEMNLNYNNFPLLNDDITYDNEQALNDTAFFNNLLSTELFMPNIPKYEACITFEEVVTDMHKKFSKKNKIFNKEDKDRIDFPKEIDKDTLVTAGNSVQVTPRGPNSEFSFDDDEIIDVISVQETSFKKFHTNAIKKSVIDDDVNLENIYSFNYNNPKNFTNAYTNINIHNENAFYDSDNIDLYSESMLSGIYGGKSKINKNKSKFGNINSQKVITQNFFKKQMSSNAKNIALINSSLNNGIICTKEIGSNTKETNNDIKLAFLNKVITLPTSAIMDDLLDVNSINDINDSSDSSNLATKRKFHNVLERKRRDDLNKSFVNLQRCILDLPQHTQAPKVTILKRATETIAQLKEKSSELDTKHADLLLQIQALEHELAQ